jgi:hypothetical protein
LTIQKLNSEFEATLEKAFARVSGAKGKLLDEKKQMSKILGVKISTQQQFF